MATADWEARVIHEPSLPMHWSVEIYRPGSQVFDSYVKHEACFTRWGARWAAKRMLRKARRGGYNRKATERIT